MNGLVVPSTSCASDEDNSFHGSGTSSARAKRPAANDRSKIRRNATVEPRLIGIRTLVSFNRRCKSIISQANAPQEIEWQQRDVVREV